MKEEKELRDPINFTRVLSVFMLGFFAYITIVISVLLLVKTVFTIEDFFLMIFPLPIFIGAVLYLLDKDEKIAKDNEDIQKEIDRVKESHNVRKRAEEELDK